MTLFEINTRLANLVERVKTAVNLGYLSDTTDEEYKIVQKDFYKVSAQIEVANIVNAGIKCDTTPQDSMINDFHSLVRLYVHLKDEHNQMVSRTMLVHDFPKLKNKYKSNSD